MKVGYLRDFRQLQEIISLFHLNNLLEIGFTLVLNSFDHYLQTLYPTRHYWPTFVFFSIRLECKFSRGTFVLTSQQTVNFDEWLLFLVWTDQNIGIQIKYLTISNIIWLTLYGLSLLSIDVFYLFKTHLQNMN